MLKRIISKIVPNVILNKLKKNLGIPNQESSFKRLKKLGFTPELILDIGAYEGNWALDVLIVFPNAKIMMIEGQNNKETILKKKAASNSNLTYQIALLGSQEKDVEFNIYETASSIYKEDNYTGASIELIGLKRLDDILLNTIFEKPELIKIDTQGYELEILKGGTNTLKHANAVLLEVSFLNIYKGAPLAHEIIAFMKANDFILYDICSIIRRPYDNALYQSDFLFIKENFDLRLSTRWA